MSPAIVLLVGLFILPVFYAIYLGFTDLQLVGPTSVNFHFTGLDNVQTLLNDDLFGQSLWLTVVFAVGSGVIGATFVGLLLAILMQHAIRVLSLLVAGVVLLAFMLPPVIIAIVWYAASTQGGTFPVLIGQPDNDLLHNLPLLFVSIANTWCLAGLSMIVFSAALRNISQEVVEAALIENASTLQRFVRITWPLLTPTVVMLMLMNSLLSLGNYAIIYILTGGGPANETNILPVYSYLEGFQFERLGYGALLGDVVVLVAGLLAFMTVRAARVRI